MNATLTFIFLLRCWRVWSLARGRSASFSVAFSGGTLLLVDGPHGRSDKTTDSGPTVQILSSAPLSQDPGSPQMLVCLLAELASPLQDVLWWVNDTVVASSDVGAWRMRSEPGGAYSVISVWEVPAADWSSKSTYWCGTIQEGQVFRQSVCSRD